jgi:hypothetical protein
MRSARIGPDNRLTWNASAEVEQVYPGDCTSPGCRRGLFNQITLLKRKYPHLKFIMSVGEWTDSGPFYEMASTDAGRKAFVDSCTTFLKTYPQQLIDVYPDSVEGPVQMRGYELMVAGDVMRGRYWKGFQVATPIPSNTPVEFTVDLHQLAYTFQRGHRVMVQVQSTWFPLYDRNPRTFVPNIFKATATDHRVIFDRMCPSINSARFRPVGDRNSPRASSVCTFRSRSAYLGAPFARNPHKTLPDGTFKEIELGSAGALHCDRRRRFEL